MAQTVFETSLPLVEQGLTWINKCVILGVLTNAIVAAANTVALLKSGINTAALAVPETSLRFVDEVTRSGGSIDRSVAIGVLSDAILAPLTTVAQLQALFTTQDANIQSADQAHSTVA